MSEDTGSQDGPAGISETEIRKRYFGFLLGGVLCMLAGTYIAVQSYKAFGVFDFLKATGIYDSPVVAGAGMAVFLPFMVIRTKGWLQWAGLTLVSVPFTAWYAFAGTLAGLVRWLLPLESGNSVIVLALALLDASVIYLHIAFFRRLGMITEEASDADDEISPSDILHGTLSVLPGFLLVFLLGDMLQSSGLASGYPGIHWDSLILAAVPCISVIIGASPRTPGQRVKLAAIVAGLMVGAALLAVAAVFLFATVVSDRRFFLGIIATTFASIFLAKRLGESVKRWVGSGGL